MSETAIRAEGLTRYFGDFTAVDNVSFSVEKSAIFGLLGPNGAGKSTIIRMLCGVLAPSSGTGSVFNVDIRENPEEIKRHIGYMSQRFSLYSDLTVAENLDFYGRIYGLPARKLRQRRNAVVEMTNIEAYLHRLGGALSGGWKQRLALACALIHEPGVLFLDEPTAGIDPVARRELWDLLFRLSNEGVTMLVTTHYMDEAERCTNVGYIYLARLIVSGEPAVLKSNPGVTPAGTRRYTVVCRNPAAALAEANRLQAVKDATLFGDRLHILVDEALQPARLLSLVAPDDHTATCHKATPSLEDVFVLLSRAAAKT